MFPFQDLPRIVLLGVGATIVMDVWLLALTRLGVQTLNFAFLGRWVGHLARGRFAHLAIAKADPIPAEALVGWTAHYAVGVGFAGLLVGIHGVEWARYPPRIPARLFGAGTVVITLLVMQPAMGAPATRLRHRSGTPFAALPITSCSAPDCSWPPTLSTGLPGELTAWQAHSPLCIAVTGAPREILALVLE